jgi:hypothetical protein
MFLCCQVLPGIRYCFKRYKRMKAFWPFGCGGLLVRTAHALPARTHACLLQLQAAHDTHASIPAGRRAAVRSCPYPTLCVQHSAVRSCPYPTLCVQHSGAMLTPAMLSLRFRHAAAVGHADVF